MTADATPATGPAARTLLPLDSTGSGHAHFGRLLLAEWTKLRSVRSTYWSLIALILVFPFFCWLFPWLTVHNWSQADQSQQAQVVEDPISTIMASGMYIGQLAVGVLGVLVTASEYSTGMIRSTLLASPRRVRMLAAKSVVFGLLVLVIGEIVSFAGFYIGQQTFKSLIPISLNGSDIRQVLGGGLYLSMLALFSMVLGALIRHSAGAITGVVALLLVLSRLIALVPGQAGKYLFTYEPTNAGFAILGHTLPSNFVITPWEGYGVFAAWTAALWILAAWILVKRDA